MSLHAHANVSLTYVTFPWHIFRITYQLHAGLEEASCGHQYTMTVASPGFQTYEGSAPPLSNDRLLPNTFQYIIHNSSCRPHCTVWGTDNVVKQAPITQLPHVPLPFLSLIHTLLTRSRETYDVTCHSWQLILVLLMRCHQHQHPRSYETLPSFFKWLGVRLSRHTVRLSAWDGGSLTPSINFVWHINIEQAA